MVNSVYTVLRFLDIVAKTSEFSHFHSFFSMLLPMYSDWVIVFSVAKGRLCDAEEDLRHILSHFHPSAITS